jgi:hypothetical protein
MKNDIFMIAAFLGYGIEQFGNKYRLTNLKSKKIVLTDARIGQVSKYVKNTFIKKFGDTIHMEPYYESKIISRLTSQPPRRIGIPKTSMLS